MANEDSRENSVVGSAIKLAATGAAIYGVARGGRGVIKHYDDLGETFLGGVGKSISSKLDDGIRAFDKSDGTNSIRKGLDNAQEKILQKDYTKQLKNTDKMYNNVGLELTDDTITSSHEAYNDLNRVEKRSAIRGLKEEKEEMMNDLKESKYDNLKEYLMNDEDASEYVDATFDMGVTDIKGTRTLDIKGKAVKL